MGSAKTVQDVGDSLAKVGGRGFESRHPLQLRAGVRPARSMRMERTPGALPPVVRAGSQFRTTNLRIFVLGAIVLIVVVAIFVASRAW